MPVRIITDSACDLPLDVIQKYDIDVVPILVYHNVTEYLDGVTLQPSELLQEMRHGKVYRTSQIPPQMFVDRFIQYAQRGESCIYLSFSSGLSGIFQSATMAKGLVQDLVPDFTMEVIDTKCASIGLGLVVYEAAKMAKAGKSLEEIVETVHFVAEHMEHIVTVDNLDYLYRGGRVSRAAAFIGGILNIKPILDVEDGKLIPIEKVRGRKNVLRRMVQIMGERGVNLANQIIGVNHGDDMEGATQLMEMITAEYGCTDFLLHCIGAAVGAHSGPGTLSVFFLNKERP